jgi:hypothetical protein
LRVCGEADGGEEAVAWVRWLRARTRNLFSNERIWAGVKAVAAALLAKPHLTGKEARAAYVAGRDVGLEAFKAKSRPKRTG